MFGLIFAATAIGALVHAAFGGGSSSNSGSTSGGSNSSVATSGNTTGQDQASWDGKAYTVPLASEAQYPRINEFVSFSLKNQDYSPSYTNLWSFHIATPPILKNVIGFNHALGNSSDFNQTVGQPGGNFVAELGNLRSALNYYCQTVNLPSRQATTGGLVNIGAAQKYATGQAFSQISATFMIPRNQHTRNFFERWLQLMAPDANQYTEYYNFYVSPRISIYKWERRPGVTISGANLAEVADGTDLSQVSDLGSKYDLTGKWELWNAFPYNLGSVQLNNDRARMMTVTVGFYFERYRFFPKDAWYVDEVGPMRDIAIPRDNQVDATRDAQVLQHLVKATTAQLVIG